MQAEMNMINRTVVQGQFDTSDDPNVCLSTILGSCVSICLFDTTIAVGGMNHFLLPGELNSDSQDQKYGVNAMELLINKLLVMGAGRSNLQAKVFGGANMNESLRDIGKLNGEFAFSFLELESIPILSSSLGGNNARRLRFWPTTGAVKQMIVPAHEFNVTERPSKPAALSETSISLF